MKNTNVKNKNERDYSKYVFEGEHYGKGPLVLAVIHKYAKEHPQLTVEKLKEAFPRKELRSSLEIVELAKKARKGRYFPDKEDLINLQDATVAVTNQWGSNIDVFIKFVRLNLNFKIRVQHA